MLGLAMAALAACSGDPLPEADTAADASHRASRPALVTGNAGRTTARAADAMPSAPAAQAGLDGAAAGTLQLVLLPLGDIPLGPGGVERSFRLQLRNDGGAPLPAALLELVQVPPGVEVVRGRITTPALGAQASASPSDTLVVRLRDAGLLDLSSLGWRWMAAPARAQPVPKTERLLDGDPAALAVSALGSVAAAQPGFTGARLHALLAPGARVRDVNAALRGAQVRIDEMRPGNHTLVLTPPWPGEQAARSAAAQLTATAVFERVHVSSPLPVEAAAARAGRAAESTSGAQGGGSADDSCSD
jgi:hypothetical protein